MKWNIYLKWTMVKTSKPYLIFFFFLFFKEKKRGKKKWDNVSILLRFIYRYPKLGCLCPNSTFSLFIINSKKLYSRRWRCQFMCWSWYKLLRLKLPSHFWMHPLFGYEQKPNMYHQLILVHECNCFIPPSNCTSKSSLWHILSKNVYHARMHGLIHDGQLRTCQSCL